MDEPLRTLWEESVSGASDLPSVSQASATASQLYGGWAARLLGSPALSKLLVRLLRRWDRASVRRIPVRSALSRFIAEAMVRVYGIPLPSVVYHGLPNEYGSASLPTGVRAPAPIVLCVGAFIPYKDHRTLIEAWRRIERGGRFPSASLVLVGEGPLGPVLSARSAGLARVRFVGGASDAEVIDWYRRSALVVQPAIAEAFGMTPVEAAAFGVPAIVTRSGGIVEGVVDGLTGRTVAPRDPDEMARAIGSLLEDTDGRSAMGVRARSRQQSLFRIDRTARELLALGARGRPGRSRPR
jgi:glycosyltransferase involved in cell wall biosynthesis